MWRGRERERRIGHDERERERRIGYDERERERDGLAMMREGERENSNSKTLFYKDCSLGSVKNLTTSHRERERENQVHEV